MASPRICIFTETYYPVIGGGETQARRLAESLAGKGFSVIVLTRRTDASLKKKESIGPVTVYRLPPAGARHFKKWGLLITGLPALIKLRHQFDLIFVSGFRVIGLLAVIVSRLIGKACILKADSLGEMSGEFFNAGLTKLRLSSTSLFFKTWLVMRNRILRQADFFVAVSSEVAEELKIHGVNPNMIRTIPNSVDINTFSPVTDERRGQLRRKFNISPENTVVVYTGRLVSYKGLPLLMEVWHKIQCQHRHVTLVLVGSGSLDIHNCEDQLREYVEKNDLQPSVLFAGEAQNVHEYLQASDIFIFPTENEAFGISLIEAMACGLPAISTSVGGVKDILVHRQNGLVVFPGEFQPLYDALDLLLGNPSFAVKLGEAGLKDTRQKYSTDTVTQQYIGLFNYAANIPH